MNIKYLFLAVGLCCVLLDGNAQSNQVAKQPERIMLTWSDDPSNTQSVSWRVNGGHEKAIGQIVEEQSNPDLEKGAVAVEGTMSFLERGQQKDP